MKLLRWCLIRPLMIIALFVCMFSYFPYKWITKKNIFESNAYVKSMTWCENTIKGKQK